MWFFEILLRFKIIYYFNTSLGYVRAGRLVLETVGNVVNIDPIEGSGKSYFAKL